MESLCLPKINAKMPNRTKSVEMSKIVSNSEIHLHHSLCESKGFTIGKSNHRRCLEKKMFLKISQNWQKRTCVRVWHGFSNISFTKFFCKHYFYRTLLGDCFWSRGLMVKSFYSVLLIFLNSEFYHAPSVWWLLIWCNEEHFLIKKIWLNFN